MEVCSATRTLRRTCPVTYYSSEDRETTRHSVHLKLRLPCRNKQTNIVRATSCFNNLETLQAVKAKGPREARLEWELGYPEYTASNIKASNGQPRGETTDLAQGSFFTGDRYSHGLQQPAMGHVVLGSYSNKKEKHAFLLSKNFSCGENITIKSLDLPPDIQPSDVTDMRNHRCTPHKYPFATTNSIVEPMAVKRPTNRARELRDPRETYRTNPLVIILGFFRTGINIHSLRKGIGLYFSGMRDLFLDTQQQANTDTPSSSMQRDSIGGVGTRTQLFI
ncbi:hypothetical protein HZH68_011572 [Vespula germanica]|uniref:Uncharacterized protein n=1 Tax=Vespula germanica TaxID=30212 RepID=A0A834N1X6_VESGE|nr:hypothetical protein HZH68_011572 [Vespula germanica]